MNLNKYITILLFFSSCISIKLIRESNYGLTLKKGEIVSVYVILDNKVNNYWTTELENYLSKDGIIVIPYKAIEETLYPYLIQLNWSLLDSTVLKKINELANVDFLLVGNFNSSSIEKGRGFSISTPYEQINENDKYDRKRNFNLTVFDLKTGYKVFSSNASSSYSGLGFGGNDLDGRTESNQTRVYFASDFKLKKKAFKKSIEELCCTSD